MVLPENIRKCVTFVGIQMANGEMRAIGTAFMLGRQIGNTDKSFIYVTTARHVIEGAKRKGLDKVFLRFNTREGSATWVDVGIALWKFHPTDASVDVAVFHAKFPEGYDFLLYPVAEIATPEIVAKEQIDCGEEIFIVGLFTHHQGQRRNIPIVRIGNIAAMPEEPVRTELGDIEAYLIEARSIGGLSGSPVFAHLGPVRFRDGKTFVADGKAVYHLLGLVHGHWDTREEIEEVRGVNVGIGIVVPAAKILEVIDQPAIAEVERAFLQNSGL